MITLTNGLFQAPNNLAVANGSIRFQLNTDATVIASPYGQVSSNIPIVFQFDANGDIQSGAQLWSNFELNPQTVDGLGTWYLVSWFDQNGAQLSDPGVLWQFTQTNGSTVDIGTMTSISPTGPYYPFPFAGTGTVTSVASDCPELAHCHRFANHNLRHSGSRIGDGSYRITNFLQQAAAVSFARDGHC